MTEPLDPELAVDEIAEPVPYDALSALTVDELNIGSRHLRGSLVATITGRTEGYEHALALVLWLHHRRADRSVSPDSYLLLTFQDLGEQLEQLTPGPTIPER